MRDMLAEALMGYDTGPGLRALRDDPWPVIMKDIEPASGWLSHGVKYAIEIMNRAGIAKPASWRWSLDATGARCCFEHGEKGDIADPLTTWKQKKATSGCGARP